MSAIVVNTVLVRKLPLLEGMIVMLHIFAFLAVIVVLWVMGPRGSARETFTVLSSSGGWHNVGLTCLIGLCSPMVSLVGPDSSSHFSEELQDASLILPRAMIATAITNYTTGLVMTVTLMTNLGDLAATVASRTGQPYVHVLRIATGSDAATCTLTVLVGVLLLSGEVNQATTSSRRLFAFARDGGLPFSTFLGKVRPGWVVPGNAVAVTFVITAPLSIIVFGSKTALMNITTLTLAGLIASYSMAIGCIYWKRLRGERLPSSRFSLGRFGYIINSIALAWLALSFVMMFFPGEPSPSKANMNWTPLIFGGVVAFSALYYLAYARHTYVGPVKYLRKSLERV